MKDLVFKHLVVLFELTVEKGLSFNIQHFDDCFCLSIFSTREKDIKYISGICDVFLFKKECIDRIRELKLLVKEYE